MDTLLQSAVSISGRRHGYCRALLLASLFLGLCCTAGMAQELVPWTRGAAPPLDLPDQQAQQQTLAHHQGRIVLVHFWATWCEPCREELPTLQQLRAAVGPERLVVLAVNYGESYAKVQGFAQRLSVDFLLLFDKHMEAAKTWRVRVLPTTMVIGPEGAVHYSAEGPLDWSDPVIRERIMALIKP